MNLPTSFRYAGMHLCAALLLAAIAGCSSTPQLMPTPNLYTRGDVDPLPNVPPALQNNHVDVLYLTDRQAENDTPDNRQYGYKRSRSVAFGVSQVEFGKDVSWDDLVKASKSKTRDVDLSMHVTSTKELAVFPPTPRVLVEIPPTGPTPAEAATQPKPTTGPSTVLANVDVAMQRCEAELSARLALTPDKEVYVFIHGYNNTFDDSVRTIAQLWHFFGRRGVPVAYSWPAGRGGLLRGYTYDRESSEFTVYHLKEMMRAIAANPDVKKVHIISHSRGTGVLTSALHELHLEINASGRSTRDVLKLGTVVLAAPDMDFDVVLQRMTTARVGRVPERFAVYVCAQDEALGLSNWLFGGVMRLGKLRSNVFKPEELAALRASKTVQVVDARISNAGAFGHDYFHSNPAVSSDLILLIRYQLAPGVENGRPLEIDDNGGFWVIKNDYPGDTPLPPPEKVPVTQPANTPLDLSGAK